MNNYLDILKTVPLFNEINEKDLSSLLTCLSAKIKHYKANEFIFNVSDKAEYVGIVLSGTVQIVKYDFFGNRNILANVKKSHLFAEAFACADVKTLPICALAVEDCDILLINYKKIITTCHSSCSFHNTLIFNMLKIVANKNLLLNQKIEIISKRTTKEKIMSYLSYQAKKAGSNSFLISFNRQELADFLCVDRSAMSNELCKLRDEGIIEFNKNKFNLL